jgi:hypothetical protein
MASPPPHTDAHSGGKNYISCIYYGDGNATSTTTRICTYLNLSPLSRSAQSQRPIRGPPGPPDTPDTPDKISGIPDTPDTPDTPGKIQIAQEGLLSPDLRSNAIGGGGCKSTEGHPVWSWVRRSYHPRIPRIPRIKSRIPRIPRIPREHQNQKQKAPPSLGRCWFG